MQTHTRCSSYEMWEQLSEREKHANFKEPLTRFGYCKQTSAMGSPRGGNRACKVWHGCDVGKIVELQTESCALDLKGAALQARVKVTCTYTSTKDTLLATSPTIACDLGWSFNDECAMPPLKMYRAAKEVGIIMWTGCGPSAPVEAKGEKLAVDSGARLLAVW